MLKYIKETSKHIPIITFVFILLYGITTFATGGSFDSGNVKYDNTNSGLQSNNVEDAIDELYGISSDYSAYNSRITAIENKIGSDTLSTTNQTLTGAINEIDDRFDSNRYLKIANGGTGTGGSSSTNLSTIKAQARTNLEVPHTSDIPGLSSTSIVYYGLTFAFYKYGYVVNVVVDGQYDTSGTSSTWTSSLKSKLKPDHDVNAPVHSNIYNGLYTSVIRMAIDTTGTVGFMRENGKYYHGTFSYVASNDTPLS